MKRFFTFFLFVLVAFNAFGQTTVFSVAGGSTLPSGWTGTNNVTAEPIDKSSYYLVEAGSTPDRITTTSYNLSGYTNVSLAVQVATFGSGANNSLRVEVSTDGGTSYTQSYTSSIPTSSTYIAGGPISISSVSGTTVFRFSNNGTSGRGVRIQNLVLTATPTATPSIAISNGSIAAANITQGDANVILQRYDLAVTTANATLNGLTVTTAGTYAAADLANLKVRYSTDATLDAGDATLSTKTTGLAAGSQVFPSFTSQVISSGSTGYIFITADIASGATAGNTINIATTAFIDISFASGNKTGTDPVAAGGTQTIVACTTPSVVTGFSGTNANTQSVLNWTNGSCFDEMLVVARAGSAVSFTPSGDGSAYTANAAFGSGTDVGSSQFVVYKGAGTTQTVTSLTNGTVYHFAVYTRRGSNWSAAVVANATPVASTNASDYFRSRTSGDWATPNTWESSSDNNTWITATLAPTSTSTAINIRNSHTVTITSNIAVDDVTIENGGIVSLNSTNGTLNLDNGTAANDLDIQNGGLLTISGNQLYSGTVRPGTGANINIQTGGKITFTGSGGGYSALGSSSTNYTWNDGAIFEWNSTTTPSMSNVTIFPNANASTVPILRVSSAWGSPGGGSPTIINGKIEVNASFTWNTSSGGTKTFRNGIIGTATMSQSTGSVWQITGTSAEIGGGVTLSLGTNGLSINSGSITTVSANATINSGTLTVASGGTIDIGTSTLSGTGGFTLSSGALIKTSNATGVAGSVTTTSKSFSSGANYEFKGSATGPFTTSPTANTVNNLTINNTSGISLDMPLSVANTLTLTSGKLTLGSNNLIIGASGTISGGSATSYVATTGTGTLKVATGGLLPIGTASVYAPVTVTNAGAADNFSAKVKSVALNTDFTCNADVTKTVKLQWDVNEDVAGGSLATLIFQWAASEEGASFNRNSAIFVGHCNGTAYDYIKSATLGGADPYTATVTDISAFSPFVIRNDNPLSAELLNFKAKSVANTAVLSWQTTSEKDNAFFGIEHATNGNDFREIAQVKGNGTTTQLADYQYIHTTPSVGANYYRLRQVDFNGTTTHSPIRSVWVSSKGKISLFPTVSQHEITLRTDDTENIQNYEIYNMLGGRVLFGELQGQKTILVSELSRGVYVLKINGENLKFIKE